ncbi:MAG TPA: ABC transporter substrate-binding protein [Gaiellaceae bacterium]
MTAVTVVVALAIVAGALAAGSSPSKHAVSGNTLTIGVDNGSPTLQRNFNPYSGSKRTGVYYMYEPLEFVNPLNGAYTPFLATGHRFVNPKTLQFTIRRGVKWSDGKSFTAADVVFTFDLLKKNAGLDSTGIWQHVGSVSAKGRTVTFTFKTADVPFAQQVASTLIVPKHIWAGISNPTTDTNPDPVVTGPYLLDSFNPNQYTLKKNPNYWQANKVAASELVFPALTGNQTSQLQLSRGAYDWATLFIPNVRKTWVSNDSAHNAFWFPPGGTITLYLNLTKAPFNSLAFRQGLSYALNRNEIATKAEDGYVQAASQSGLLLPNLKQWLSSSLPSQGDVAYNASKAQAMFAKAGYHKHGSKLIGPNGKQVSFSLTTVSGFTDWLQGAQVIQQQLRQAGINVSLQTPQYAEYFSSLQNGSYDTALGGFGGTGSPYIDLSNLLSSSLTAPVGKPAASNFERWKNQQTDKLLAEFRSTTSKTKQMQDAAGLERIMYQQVPVIALFYGANWGEYSTKSFTGWPSASDPYAPPIPYNEAPLEIVTHLKAAT